MKFYTANVNGTRKLLYRSPGRENYYDLSEALPQYQHMNQLVISMTEEQISALEESIPESKPVPKDGIFLLSPILEPVQDIICLGINYREHAVEAESFSDKDFGGKREKTIYFSKRASEISGPEAEIPSYPELVDSLDYEAELAVILGKDAKNITADQAKEYIFGYSVFNDVSARNLQTGHKQWYFGKSLDGHSIMGPCIVTRDEIPDVYNLAIRCYVNGELRQNSNTGRMIQKIEETIEELSRGITLKAGTIIATGTPAGVGMGFQPPKFLQPGDTVRCEIEGIGTLNNTVK